MVSSIKYDFSKINQNNLKKKLIGSIVFNFTIFVLMIIGISIIWTVEIDFDGGKWTYNTLKYFTFQTNVFNGVVCFIYATYACLMLSKKLIKLPKQLEITKHCATVGVGVTCIIVIFAGIPASFIFVHEFPIKLFWYSNSLYHVVIPILTIISWFVFEHRNNEIKYFESLYSLIYVYIYSIFYLAMSLSHMQNGSIPTRYDWYYMWTFGPYIAPLILLGTYGTSWFVSWATWYGNKKIDIFPLELNKKIKA